MWDRENPYELQFLPGESCFRVVDEDSPHAPHQHQEEATISSLQTAIIAAQVKLKQLRAIEVANEDTIRQLKGVLHTKSAALVPNNGVEFDFAILLDSDGMVTVLLFIFLFIILLSP